MTEQEAKQYKPGDKVIITCPGPDKGAVVEVLEIIESSSIPGYWSVKTNDHRYGYFTWGVAGSLCHQNPPVRASVQECAQIDSLEEMTASTPADPPRSLCPVEGERETIDWEAHRRFMRGLG